MTQHLIPQDVCRGSVGCSHNPVLHDKLLCCNGDCNAERWDAKCDLPASGHSSQPDYPNPNKSYDPIVNSVTLCSDMQCSVVYLHVSNHKAKSNCIHSVLSSFLSLSQDTQQWIINYFSLLGPVLAAPDVKHQALDLLRCDTMLFCELWHHVVGQVVPDIAKDHSVFIFRHKKS